MLNVYLGWDRREESAYRVAQDSLERNSSRPVKVHRLDAADLYQKRLLWRPVEMDGNRMLDHLSGAYQSTEFATSRFLVPFIQRTGWALFTDCDVVFLGDVAELFALADDRYAVMCVKHDYRVTEGIKMDGQAQLAYSRKNWSSVMLINCDHPAYLRMSLAQFNQWPGELLHQFRWLRDSEIGELPAAWNWLVNATPKPEEPKIAHFTAGGPWLPNWKPAPFDEVWHAASIHSHSQRA